MIDLFVFTRYRHVLVPKMDLAPEDQPSLDDDAAAAVNEQKKEPDVTCSICMENIYEMKKTFGILPNCVHAFCEPCIVTWRRMDRYRPDVVKYVSLTSNLTVKNHQELITNPLLLTPQGLSSVQSPIRFLCSE